MPSPGKKDEHKGKNISWKFLFFSEDFSLPYEMWESDTLNTYTESFSQQHGGGTRKNVRKIMWQTESRLLNFSNKRSLEKNALSAGVKPFPHLQEVNKPWMCKARMLFMSLGGIFLFKWAIIITSKLLSNFVLIRSKFSTYKNILAWYQNLTACCAEPWKDPKTFRRQG